MKILSDNRRARYDYHLMDRFEAGLALTGTEVKSARDGKVQLREGFAELLQPLSKPGLRITQSLQPTVSHFGGLPPSQPAFTWPHRGGRPLTLLARFDLAVVPPVIEWLPRGHDFKR